MSKISRRAQDSSRFDPYRQFVEQVPNLVTMARSAARIKSKSYRDFNVGDGLMVVDAEDQVGYFAAGNLKTRSSRDKVCAEKIALNQARKAGFLYAVGHVIAATTDVVKIEEVTGAPTPTLHSCGECLGMFLGHPLMRREALIVSVGQEDDAYQVMTSGEMRDMYTLDPAAIEEQPMRFGFDDWDLHIAAYDQLIARRSDITRPRQQDLAEMAKLAILYPTA